jgi:RNA polymerase sigma-70 factor, ECF subfamily
MSAPAPSADELKQWIKAVADERDRGAFGRLFQFFAPRVASFVERGGLSGAEAEEIAQETMVAVWRKAALYDSAQAGVSTWVFTIARNLRIDQARKSWRANASRAATSEFPIEFEASVEDAALANERDQRVRRAMAKLSPEQLTVLRLSFFSEKPHAEIARELAIPLGTVKSRARLAMAKIRAILEQEP